MYDIKNRVHELYWNADVNCARTMLICLSELFDIRLEPQTWSSAVGLHGAGGFRAQCGLVEGGLMFLGIYGDWAGWTEEQTVSVCYRYADAFNGRFGSLRCYELRPEGFTSDTPPHLCEKLTGEAITFACRYIKENTEKITGKGRGED